MKSCVDCGEGFSNLRGNCIRCKDCRETYRRNRYKIYERELRKHWGWKKLKERVNRLGTADFSSHMIRDENGNPDFKRERASVWSLKQMFLKPRLKKGINVEYHTYWYYERK